MNVKQMEELENELLDILNYSTFWKPTDENEKYWRDLQQERIQNTIQLVKRELGKYVQRITHVDMEITARKTKVFVIYNDDNIIRYLFGFHPDEWSVKASELIGLTREEALELGRRRDRQYLAA
jgi:hypothetical protein